MFLRKDFEIKESQGSYMKLAQGENRFRILSDAIDGFLYWLDANDNLVARGEMGGKGSKPIRVRSLDEAMEKTPGSQYDCKQFVAFVVYNYSEEAVQILELTQKSLIQSLQGLYRSEDWGDPKEYDIVIERKGEKLETEYAVRPIPPKKFTKDIGDVSKIRLEALYESGDPFLEFNDKMDRIDIDQVPSMDKL